MSKTLEKRNLQNISQDLTNYEFGFGTHYSEAISLSNFGRTIKYDMGFDNKSAKFSQGYKKVKADFLYPVKLINGV